MLRSRTEGATATAVGGNADGNAAGCGGVAADAPDWAPTPEDDPDDGAPAPVYDPVEAPVAVPTVIATPAAGVAPAGASVASPPPDGASIVVPSALENAPVAPLKILPSVAFVLVTPPVASLPASPPSSDINTGVTGGAGGAGRPSVVGNLCPISGCSCFPSVGCFGFFAPSIDTLSHPRSNLLDHCDVVDFAMHSVVEFPHQSNRSVCVAPQRDCHVVVVVASPRTQSRFGSWDSDIPA